VDNFRPIVFVQGSARPHRSRYSTASGRAVRHPPIPLKLRPCARPIPSPGGDIQRDLELRRHGPVDDLGLRASMATEPVNCLSKTDIMARCDLTSTQDVGHDVRTL
jgi:hypothetical protein